MFTGETKPGDEAARRIEEETLANLLPLKTAYERAKKTGPFKAFPGGIPDPVKAAEAEWDTKQAKEAYDAAYLKYCHAMQDVQKVLSNYGCNEAVPIRCGPAD